ncbi:Uncharacterised protein [Bordetella pertussis]|nr:Uncharacterised protein [Bordetella pertussis]CFP10779.1 Uncharacterised protein [Bordetella pertussis]CFU08233.1 Uncharacterised protein [Bordetella pertussis]
MAAYRPVLESATASPARTGPWPGSPVTDIRPPMPCAIWSKPGRPAYGPLCPKPEMLARMMRGLMARSDS